MGASLPSAGSLTPRAAGARAAAAAVKQAAAAWRRLGFKEQMRLVDEIIETRAAELIKAYPVIVSLGIGLRRRRNRQGHARTSRTAKVLHLRILVRRKWKPDPGNAQRKGCIPRHLLAKTGPDDARYLVAVPTDIDAMPRRSRLKLQAMAIRGIAPGVISRGSLSCVVQQQRGGGARYLGLSCRHVLSPRLDNLSTGTTAGKVDEMATATVLGSGTALRGSFNDPAHEDFDAQFFSFLSPNEAARAISAGLSFAGVISDNHHFSLPMEIAAGNSGRSIPVRYHTVWRGWPLVAGGQVHRDLIEVRFTGNLITQDGDSGSPLLIQQAGQRPIYVGMHAALYAGAEVVSFCVPAWDLFNPALYGSAASSSVFDLL